MGFSYGHKSNARLYTCHHDIQRVAKEYIKHAKVDITIVCGARGEVEQNQWHAAGYSKVRFPFSKHNVGPGAPREVSDAFDFAPWIGGDIDWNDEGSFYAMAGGLIHVASQLGITLRYGGDWNRNGLTEDQTFMDLGHLERVVG